MSKRYMIDFVIEVTPEKIKSLLVDRVPTIGESVFFTSSKLEYRVIEVASLIIDDSEGFSETEIAVYLELI